MKKASLGIAASIILLETAAWQAQAGVIFSSFGPDDTFGTTGRVVTGVSETGNPDNHPAYTFAAASSGSVSEIDLALAVTSGNVVASLWTAATGCGTGAFSTFCGGLVPTTELGTWTAPSSSSNFVSITGITGVDLTAGTTYYLQLSAGTPTTAAEWFDNSIGATGILYQCGGYNSTFTECLGDATIGTATLGAFDILSPSTPIPEPSSLALLGVAALGFGLIRRRYDSA
jgi:hypothetical protein